MIGGPLEPLSFTRGDIAGTVRSVQFSVADDGQVEGSQTVDIVMMNTFDPMNPVLPGTNSRVSITVEDDDGELLRFRYSSAIYYS